MLLSISSHQAYLSFFVGFTARLSLSLAECFGFFCPHSFLELVVVVMVSTELCFFMFSHFNSLLPLSSQGEIAGLTMTPGNPRIIYL